MTCNVVTCNDESAVHAQLSGKVPPDELAVRPYLSFQYNRLEKRGYSAVSVKKHLFGGDTINFFEDFLVDSKKSINFAPFLKAKHVLLF